MENDPELLALPVKLMDLSGSTNRLLKSCGMKTIGDLLAKSPEQLAELGLSLPAILEIAKAAPEMELSWVTEDEVRKLVKAGGEPLRPELPKRVMAKERPTYVLTDWKSPRVEASDLPCPRCNAPMVEVAHLDLTAFPDSGLPQRSLRIGRCLQRACLEAFDETPGAWSVRLGPPGQGERPGYRKEYDYPGDDPNAFSDSSHARFLDHRSDIIGPNPRVGGWPDWFNRAPEWEKCPKCKKPLVLAFEQHLWEPGHEHLPLKHKPIDELEHAFICARACTPNGWFWTSLP